MYKYEMTEISKEKYEEYEAMGNQFSQKWGEGLSDAIKYGYGYYGATLMEQDGKYYVSWTRGDSCD